VFDAHSPAGDELRRPRTVHRPSAPWRNPIAQAIVMNNPQTFSDIACTVCGCVCDDLELTIDNGRIVHHHRACHLAESWLLAINDSRPPEAMLQGRASTMDAAIQHAACILRESRNPLIFGLSRSSTPGQRAAVQLAERLGANIDTTASVCHGPSIVAVQQVGESTCSLGEVRNRADLVIFWGANPMVSHPRHFERYSVDPAGQFVPEGRRNRTVVVVDTKPTATTELADLFLCIRPEMDFEVLWTLRALVQGEQPAVRCDLGIPIDALQDLSQRMIHCKYGVVFFGLGVAQRRLGHLTVEALLRLTRDLNAHTRFCARRLRIPGDVTGADNVLCWQTGYPFAVNLARGFPRYNPGEFSANELLARNEVDACVLVGGESVSLLSEPARRWLERIPTVLLEYPHVNSPVRADVRFTTAVYGIHAPGTAYRMDEVPIPLRCVMKSPYRTDEEVLNTLRWRLDQFDQP
jgi:formylmethanofuran dehydrogenase subunit B